MVGGAVGHPAAADAAWPVALKAAGLGVLSAFGAYHRFRLLPALGEAGTASRLIGSVRRERLVLVAVLLVAGFLAYTPLPAGPP